MPSQRCFFPSPPDSQRTPSGQVQGATLSALDVRTTLAVLVVDGAAWGSARRAVLPRPVPLELPLVGSELIS